MAQIKGVPIVIVVLCAIFNHADAVRNMGVMYPFGRVARGVTHGLGNYDHSMGCPNDDAPYGPLTFASPGISVFGRSYTTVYIGVNGLFSNEAVRSYRPQGFPINTGETVSTMCDNSNWGNGANSDYCWMTNYYASQEEWLTAVETVQAAGSSCVHGTEFVRNAGSGSWDYVSRTTVYAYVAPNCITYITSGTSWLPSTGSEADGWNWMIAVFWHDIDVRYGDAKFYFKYENSNSNGVFTLAKNDVETMYTREGIAGTFNPTSCAMVTWMDATFYGGGSKGYPSGCEAMGYPTGCESDDMYISNSMQMNLCTDGTKSYAIYNYAEMNWGGGQIGFDVGNGLDFCAIAGSRSNTITDVAIRSNIGVAGRWVLAVSNHDFPNSMCEPHINNPICVCDEGYEGVSCTSDIDECDTAPCGDGGRCSTPNANSYECACFPGYSGDNCQTANYCHNVTCQSGSCQNGASGYTCQCAGTCQNSGSCNTQTGACTCVSPYSGTTCQTRDYCIGDPCLNGGTCTSGGSSYTCSCAANTGWSGTTCSVCLTNWLGDDCSTQNFCHVVSCGAGTCVNGASGYTCNYCSPNPCQNRASCTNGASGYTCTCLTNTGWGGTACSTCSQDYLQTSSCNVRNYCNGNECDNGATCVNGASAYSCTCTDGWLGDRCTTVDFCEGNDCSHGTCVNGNSDYSCSCTGGYTGSSCGAVDYCHSQLSCLNNGVCNNGINLAASSCTCPAQFPDSLSSTCATEDFCYNSPCENGGTCARGASGYTCTCAIGWMGDSCHRSDNCAVSPCENGADCTSVGDSYTCDCTADWIGDTCNTRDYCNGHACANGGTCVNGDTSYTCTCTDDYPYRLNVLCTVRDYCNGIVCQNGGTCQNNANDYSCDCVEGTDDPNYMGTHCETRNYCDPDRCDAAHGTCGNGANDYDCTCEDWYTGEHCDVYNYCFEHSCANGGTCVNGADAYTCNCPGDWDIEFYCTVRNYCNGVTCQNGGTCYNLISSYICACVNGTQNPNYIGDHCENQNHCDPDNCDNGACVNEASQYNCTCEDGWTDGDCDVVDYCHENGCLNGATCVNVPGEQMYTCTCTADYYGDRCENFNECYGNEDCQNSATCVDGDNDFSCTCPSGWIGNFCNVTDYCHPIGEPNIICNNSALCVSGERPANNPGAYNASLNYFCDCPENWYGLNCSECNTDWYSTTGRQYCDQYNWCTTNWQANTTCNTSTTTSCVNVPLAYVCVCDDDHAGKLCNYENNCRDNLCKNNGTCIPVNDTYTCNCAKGFNRSNCAENNTDQWTRDVGTFAHQTAAALPAAVTGTVAAATGSMALLALVALAIFIVVMIRRKKKKEEEDTALFSPVSSAGSLASSVGGAAAVPSTPASNVTVEDLDW